MSPESALRTCHVAFAGKKTTCRLIVHTLGVDTPPLNGRPSVGFRSQMQLLSLPRSPLSRSLWQNVMNLSYGRP